MQSLCLDKKLLSPDILTPFSRSYALLIALLYTVSAPHYLIMRLQCQCAQNCDNYSKWWSNFQH